MQTPSSVLRVTALFSSHDDFIVRCQKHPSAHMLVLARMRCSWHHPRLEGGGNVLGRHSHTDTWLIGFRKDHKRDRLLVRCLWSHCTRVLLRLGPLWQNERLHYMESSLAAETILLILCGQIGKQSIRYYHIEPPDAAMLGKESSGSMYESGWQHGTWYTIWKRPPGSSST